VGRAGARRGETGLAMNALNRQASVSRSFDFSPLKLPSCEATRVEMKCVDHAVAGVKFELELHALRRDWLSARRCSEEATYK
jgi:hypothetical protein